jgi:hypothetical protein
LYNPKKKLLKMHKIPWGCDLYVNNKII